MTIQIAILRHGEVQGRAHVFRGTSNEPLSALGLAQMQRALARIAGAPFDTLATSPLPRCHQFATDYAAQQRLPLQVMPCFSELNFGEWEGLTPDEAAARNPSEYAAFRATHGAHAPPDGETLAAFRTRIAQGWHAWMDQGSGSHRLLVTHAGVMRALLMELLGLTPAQTFQIALPEAACLRVSHLHGQPPFLLSLN